MIVVCSHCETNLQVDDAKIPSRSFTIRCPKCRMLVDWESPAASAGQGALGVGAIPSLDNPRFKPPTAAPRFKLNKASEPGATQSSASTGDLSEAVRLLVELLQRGTMDVEKRRIVTQHGWDRRRVLVCVLPELRVEIAHTLAENGFEVFLAEDTTQALESIRENDKGILILDPGFDPLDQGAAFVTREINALRPGERRRILFVQLSDTARTLDAHAAFIGNVNLVVNLADMKHLPHALESSIREFNDLYHDFNKALNIATL